MTAGGPNVRVSARGGVPGGAVPGVGAPGLPVAGLGARPPSVVSVTRRA